MIEYLHSLPNVFTVFYEITSGLTDFGIRLMSFVSIMVVLIHGLLVLFVMGCLSAFNKRYGSEKNKNVDVLVYFVVVLLILLSHLVDIFIWTYAIVSVNVFPGVIKTFYFAGEMYTNLDHNDPTYNIGERWRILPILISFSGLFAIAISGAALYSLLISTFGQTTKSAKSS